MPKIICFCSKHLIILISLFSIINGQNIDEPCQLREMCGICTYIESCPFAEEQLKKSIHPQRCSFDLFGSVIVCCPNKAQNGKSMPIKHRERKSIEYCTRLFKMASEYSRTALVGGEEALAQEFPHMAALGFGDADDKQWHCGGTLISQNFVLTAAHCLFSAQYGDVAYVRLGDLNLKSITDDARPQDFNVASTYKHPDYIPPIQYNDIGLVRLSQSADFSIYVTPACLQTNFDLSDTSPIATGWGRLGVFENASDQLMKVTLVYYNNEQCKQSYQNIPKRRLPNGITENTQICAGGQEDESKDTCQGDSGGPLQVKTSFYPAQYHIVGITSFGRACGVKNTPGVYTRVSNYIQWIEGIVWPNSCIENSEYIFSKS